MSSKHSGTQYIQKPKSAITDSIRKNIISNDGDKHLCFDENIIIFKKIVKRKYYALIIYSLLISEGIFMKKSFH